MRISFSNVLCLLGSILIMIWGGMVVMGFTAYDLIPSTYNFLNLPSLAIVFGGVLTNVLITYPFRQVKAALRNSIRIFSQSTINNKQFEKDIEHILGWHKLIKQDGSEIAAKLSAKYDGKFQGYLFSLIDTNYSVEELRELGEAYIQETYAHQQQINNIISTMGKTAPVFGMLGTLFGLIVILAGFDDLQFLLSGLGAALMTTFYGILIGNLIFNPVARKMHNISSIEYFRKKLILEGIILIRDQKTSLQIYDRLKAHTHSSKSLI